MEELALASFSACCAGELVFNTWGAVLKREDRIRTWTETKLQQEWNPVKDFYWAFAMSGAVCCYWHKEWQDRIPALMELRGPAEFTSIPKLLPAPSLLELGKLPAPFFPGVHNWTRAWREVSSMQDSLGWETGTWCWRTQQIRMSFSPSERLRAEWGGDTPSLQLRWVWHSLAGDC